MVESVVFRKLVERLTYSWENRIGIVRNRPARHRSRKLTNCVNRCHANENGRMPKHATVKYGRYWTPNSAENTEKTMVGDPSGALCVARWGEIRELIAVCDDLPDDVKRALIEVGDATTHVVRSHS